MENHNLDKLAVPITPGQIRKTDLDLATIKSLNAFALSNGLIVVLTGGYATEALCGGNITRPHGDVDIHLQKGDIGDAKQIFSLIEEEIIFKESTNWKTYNSIQENLATCCEDELNADMSSSLKRKPRTLVRGGRHKQTDTKSEYREEDESKPFFDRRRLETVLYASENMTWYVPAFLVDSHGERINVQVVEINDLLAQKIHKLYSLKDGVDTSKERHTDDRDIYDLKRLLNSPNFDLEKMLRILAENRVQAEAKGDKIDQARKEFDYVSDLYK